MSNDPQREMTLREYVEVLPSIHRARKEYEELMGGGERPEHEQPRKDSARLDALLDPANGCCVLIPSGNKFEQDFGDGYVVRSRQLELTHSRADIDEVRGRADDGE